MKKAEPPNLSDPTVKFLGHYPNAEIHDTATAISAVGVRSNSIKGVVVREFIDRLLNAQHLALFMVQFSPGGIGTSLDPIETQLSTLSVSATGGTGEIGIINTGNLLLSSLSFSGVTAAVETSGVLTQGSSINVTGNLGLRIPVTSNEQNLMAHYSLMLDYYTCRWFIPFVSANFWTNLNDGNNIALRGNGYDVINFGANNVNGVTQGTVGFGFRSRVVSNVDLGFAYEIAVARPYGLTNNRLTVDMCIRF